MAHNCFEYEVSAMSMSTVIPVIHAPLSNALHAGDQRRASQLLCKPPIESSRSLQTSPHSSPLVEVTHHRSCTYYPTICAVWHACRHPCAIALHQTARPDGNLPACPNTPTLRPYAL